MKNKKVLFIVPYPHDKAPSQRLKFEQFYPLFEEAGYEITLSPFIDYKFWEIIYKPGRIFTKVLYTLKGYFQRIKDLLRLRRYDIVYIHLWVTPLGPPLLEYLFCLLHPRVVYDIDDMIFLGHSSYANKLIEFLKGKQKMIVLMKKAEHVITCTPALDDFVRRYNNETTDISSTVNTDIYTPVNPYNNDKPLVIGWSGSHSTSRYLYLLKDVFLELKEHVNFTLKVIGDPNFNIEGINVDARAWNGEEELAQLQQFDIGVYPLPEEQWVYGKSGLKAIQYMGLGIPPVATAIGANYRVIEDGKSGFLVKTPSEWLEKLLLLINNPDLRKSIGVNARKRIEDLYSVKANTSKYLDVLKTVSKL